ncbi:TPA: site-specific integrase [Vibrio vulnificus]|nr:site-specific integrase [Vibrio parahaemolyticus]HCH5603795.1 site-specific integrase [Vibrio parahaemolyticus]HDY7660539.1 site-specific integrase [Vibrio vulnificus]HDY7697437.1 site-specific integrase [Vibrio vulnificus]
MVGLGDNVSVKIYRDTTGYSFPLVVRGGVFPACLYLNAYLNGNHNSPLSKDKGRSSAQAPAFHTRKKYAYELKLLYCHFTQNSIDLVERVASGAFISRAEVDDFVRVCKLYTHDESAQLNANVVRISDSRIRDAIHATANSQPQVSAHTFRQRLIRLRAYVEYLYVCHHYDQVATNQKIETDDQFNKFKLYINAFISGTRRNNTITRDVFESVIPDDKFFRLLEIIKESSTDNPFKSSKLRNQIIIQILIETGVRVGAVMKLKISDLIEDWSNPRFLLTRTPDDPSDPRLDPASNKTKALSVSISPDLMKLIKLYISTVRATSKNIHKHDFVFIAEKGKTSGQPLTYKTIYKIVKTFGDVINLKLNPHKLRYKWNEVFEDKAKEMGFSPEKIEDLRKYAMGWVEDSKMASVYNEFQLAVAVADISAKNQRKAVPNLKGNNNE